MGSQAKGSIVDDLVTPAGVDTPPLGASSSSFPSPTRPREGQIPGGSSSCGTTGARDDPTPRPLLAHVFPADPERRCVMRPTTRRLIAGVAVVAGVATLAGAFLTRDDSQTSSAPQTPAAATTESAAPPSCALNVASVTLTLDPNVAADFLERRLIFETIAPGTELVAGTSTAPLLYTSRDVSCDLRRGFIGMRGGFRVRSESHEDVHLHEVEFRRFRIELDTGELYAFFASTGAANVEALDLEVDEAAVSQDGARMTADVPIVLDEDGAVALNAALGTDFSGDELTLGTMTVTGTRATTRPQA